MKNRPIAPLAATDRMPTSEAHLADGAYGVGFSRHTVTALVGINL
jgi:hypothetical protein